MPVGTVLAVIEDLFFLVQVKDAASKAGLDLKTATSPGAILDTAAASKPVLIVLDLNCTAASPLDTIRALKSSPDTQDIPILAYVPHVQVDLRKAAKDAGADLVAAKSAFAGSLQQMLASVAQLR
jgi:CheY-like chemotaxis protein